MEPTASPPSNNRSRTCRLGIPALAAATLVLGSVAAQDGSGYRSPSLVRNAVQQSVGNARQATSSSFNRPVDPIPPQRFDSGDATPLSAPTSAPLTPPTVATSSMAPQATIPQTTTVPWQTQPSTSRTAPISNSKPLTIRPVTSTEPQSLPTETKDSTAPIPLPPPSSSSAFTTGSGAPKNSSQVITTVVSSLAIVLGLFFGIVWMTRRSQRPNGVSLPSEVIEPLGIASLANKQQVHLVRLGKKLLLLSFTPNGSETLTEVTAADEVERLTALCRQSGPNSMSTSFRQVLQELGNEPTQPGFLSNAEQGRGNGNYLEA